MFLPVDLCKHLGIDSSTYLDDRYSNLVEVHRVMLPTKYQGSRPYGFRQEDN